MHPSNAAGFLKALQGSRSVPLLSRAEMGRSSTGRSFTRTVYRHGGKVVDLEDWTVHGGIHGWSGGAPAPPTPILAGRTPRVRWPGSSLLVSASALLKQ